MYCTRRLCSTLLTFVAVVGELFLGGFLTCSVEAEIVLAVPAVTPRPVGKVVVARVGLLLPVVLLEEVLGGPPPRPPAGQAAEDLAGLRRVLVHVLGHGSFDLLELGLSQQALLCGQGLAILRGPLLVSPLGNALAKGLVRTKLDSLLYVPGAA